MTMYSNGTAESSDKGIAQLFNNYFFSVYTNHCPPNFSINTLLNSEDGCLNRISYSFTPDDILNILSSLDPNKAMGIDHISPKVLRYCSSALYFPIYYLFSQYFTQSYLPYE